MVLTINIPGRLHIYNTWYVPSNTPVSYTRYLVCGINIHITYNRYQVPSNTPVSNIIYLVCCTWYVRYVIYTVVNIPANPRCTTGPEVGTQEHMTAPHGPTITHAATTISLAGTSGDRVAREARYYRLYSYTVPSIYIPGIFFFPFT